MKQRKLILLNCELQEHDFCHLLPQIVVEEFVKAGGKLYDLKNFYKNPHLRFDATLIGLIEKYHQEIKVEDMRGFVKYQRPEHKNAYDFRFFRLDTVEVGKRFTIEHPYYDHGSVEQVVYFNSIKWYSLSE